jgi:hypothetical protein
MSDWHQPSEFGEGDSGVVMTPNIKIWNEIEAGKKAQQSSGRVTVETTQFFAEIIGIAMTIARDKDCSDIARATALGVARQAGMDQLELTVRGVV